MLAKLVTTALSPAKQPLIRQNSREQERREMAPPVLNE
jgi:hypothetical protein